MFDIKKHLIKVQGGRQYLPVASRLVWFREDHADWGICTEPVTINTEQNFAIFRATIKDETGRVIAQATKHQSVRGFPDYIEKAEMGAVGRALGMCGYGTQFAPDLEDDNPQADTRGNGYGDRRAYSNGSTGYQAKQTADAGTQPEQGDDVAPYCTGDSCGVEMKPSQVSLSMRKFGRPLCPSCQKIAQEVSSR